MTKTTYADGNILYGSDVNDITWMQNMNFKALIRTSRNLILGSSGMPTGAVFGDNVFISPVMFDYSPNGAGGFNVWMPRGPFNGSGTFFRPDESATYRNPAIHKSASNGYIFMNRTDADSTWDTHTVKSLSRNVTRVLVGVDADIYKKVEDASSTTNWIFGSNMVGGPVGVIGSIEVSGSYLSATTPGVAGSWLMYYNGSNYLDKSVSLHSAFTAQMTPDGGTFKLQVGITNGVSDAFVDVGYTAGETLHFWGITTLNIDSTGSFTVYVNDNLVGGSHCSGLTGSWFFGWKIIQSTSAGHEQLRVYFLGEGQRVSPLSSITPHVSTNDGSTFTASSGNYTWTDYTAGSRLALRMVGSVAESEIMVVRGIGMMHQ